MASGIPDFYRGVDIAYQALAQLLVRPTYGGADSADGGKQVTASALTTLVTVYGEGMLYGGYIWLDHTATQKTDAPFMSIDSNTIAYEMWQALNNYGFNQPNIFPFCLSKYDDTNFIYALLLQYGLTFESEIVLKYYEDNARTPWVYYALVHALI